MQMYDKLYFFYYFKLLRAKRKKNIHLIKNKWKVYIFLWENLNMGKVVPNIILNKHPVVYI